MGEDGDNVREKQENGCGRNMYREHEVRERGAKYQGGEEVEGARSAVGDGGYPVEHD